MARKLKALQLKRHSAVTHQGASAYDYAQSQPLTHLTFSMGSALLTDAFYETEQEQVYRLVDALLGAHKVEPKFAWQYGAWMRDAKGGKGNRIQGSLVPALLDALTDESEYTEHYVALCLSHRPDDVTAFVTHYANLGLGSMSTAARRGVAKALASFDEYQLMKYAAQKADLRLCDVISMVKLELEQLGDAGALALTVGKYLHASSRDRADLADALPLTRARRDLWAKPKDYALNPNFGAKVREARVTWEQVFGHFGTRDCISDQASIRNRAVWNALFDVKGLVGDMAFLRNINSLARAGFVPWQIARLAEKRKFAEVWPHQVLTAWRATTPEYRPAVDAIFEKMIAKLPSGRHLGLADASGSMSVPVGGQKGSTTARDIAYCFTALMSETSGLGASFCDDSMSRWSNGKYLSMAERRHDESALAFSTRPELNRAWGGTQIFGAVMELITWLKSNERVKPPECLWFFSDMQFHPAAGHVPEALAEMARDEGFCTNVPPLELALKLYRKNFGVDVDVVLWNLAAYSPVPVPADMKGVLLVSGFDAHTFDTVERWRKTGRVGASVAKNADHVLETIRSY